MMKARGNTWLVMSVLWLAWAAAAAAFFSGCMEKHEFGEDSGCPDGHSCPDAIGSDCSAGTCDVVPDCPGSTCPDVPQDGCPGSTCPDIVEDCPGGGDCEECEACGQCPTCPDAISCPEVEECGGCECIPKTCQDLGKQCGTWPDGCGGWTGECGVCGGGYACTGEGECGLACGELVCPALGGYERTCVDAAHCEYERIKDATWQDWMEWDVWMWVPPGVFPMGSPTCEAGHESDEQPVHGVAFEKGFFIGKYEVVVEQYHACMEAAPLECTLPSTVDWDGAGWGTNYWKQMTVQEGEKTNYLYERLGHPQNGLTWDQAKAFCAWAAPNGRLPSEAEWEYAASGPVHRKYPWGDAPEPTCENGTAVFDGGTGWGCGSGGTAAVGSKTAGISWCGALDMAGNVWEWVEDCWHTDYEDAPGWGEAWIDQPEEKAANQCSGSNRVLRGGGFALDAAGMRAAKRSDGTPGNRHADIGARCWRP